MSAGSGENRLFVSNRLSRTRTSQYKSDSEARLRPEGKGGHSCTAATTVLA